MTDIIFPGAATHGDGLRNYLNNSLGIKSQKAGVDLVISAKDVARGFSSKNFLSLGPQLPLIKGKENEIARSLYTQISKDAKELQPNIPREQIVIQGGFGILSEISEAGTLLAVCPDIQVEKTLIEKIIPLMRKEFAAEFVTGISTDMHALQFYISLEKIALIAGRYDIEKAKKIVLEDRGLQGVLPTSLDTLAYFEALTRFSPLAFTLPFHRGNCAWHFQSKAMLGFKSEVTNSFPSRFMTSLNPLATDYAMLGLYGIKNMGAEQIWCFMRIVVDGINHLLSYLIDVRNFADVSGKVDFLRQVQAQSAVRLIFADIIAINFSTQSHHRISLAFSALDKFANLRVNLGGVPLTEPDAVKTFCSLSQRDELVRAYTGLCSKYAYDDVLEIFTRVVNECYDKLHAHLGQQGANVELERLDRLWSQRNVRHGTFLIRKQFEKLFLESDGTVPDTIAAIPFLLMLGLISDPERFLQFQPTVSS